MSAMTSPEHRSGKGREVSPEVREKAKEIARIFIFQARPIESIRDDEDLENMHFVNSLWALKEGEASGGQLTPVGGKIDEDELPEAAAMRELVEETHLRSPERSIEKVGEQHYSFLHRGKNETMRRLVHYYKGKISAPDFDIPYVLDPAEDKIAEFVSLSPSETWQLFAKGEIHRDGKVLKILDCLSPKAQDRAQSQTIINHSEREQVGREMFKHHLLTDARKKMQILSSLAEGILVKPVGDQASRPLKSPIIGAVNLNKWPEYSTEPADIPGRFQVAWNQLYHELTSFNFSNDQQASLYVRAVNDFWKEHIRDFTVADVQRAYDVTEMGAKLFNAFHYKKVSEQPRKYKAKFNLETGVGVPTANLVFALLADNLDYSKIKLLARGNPQTHRLLKRMQFLKELDTMSEEAWLEKFSNTTMSTGRGQDKKELRVLEIDSDINIQEMCQNINMYFEKLQGEADITVPLDQLDEVKQANSIKELVALAKGTVLSDRTDAPYRTEKVLQWEAKLKLTLLLLLNDAQRVRNEFMRRGTEPLDVLEDSLNLSGVEVRHRPEAKSIMSLLRKIIVRDQTLGTTNNFADVAKDVFGSAYIFNEVNPSDLEEQLYTIPHNPATNEPYIITNKQGKRIYEITAPPVLANMIFRLLEEGHGQVTAEEYTPLPPAGKSITSKGPGGGGDVRYAKFYIKHTDDNGVERYKEMQCYVPDGATGRTAKEEYHRKKVDDQRYGKARLFATQGVRSFMELLRPASIYGDGVRDIFADKHKVKKKK